MLRRQEPRVHLEIDVNHVFTSHAKHRPLRILAVMLDGFLVEYDDHVVRATDSFMVAKKVDIRSFAPSLDFFVLCSHLTILQYLMRSP